MKPKIVLYKALPEAELARLRDRFEVSAFDGIGPHNRADFMAALTEAEGLIGASAPVTTEMLAQAPRLRAVSTISVGIDQFDLATLNQRRIALMHTPSVLTETTADTLFALVIATARRVVELSNLVRDGRWQGSIGPEHFGVDVHGKTMGIIGMGRIGYALAKRARLGFDMKINYYNRSPHQQAEAQLDATRMSLDALLAEADFVCLVLPLTPGTERFIGREQFALMKPDAIFINGSRGKVVDEPALIQALQERRIRAAGLDVFEVEPLPGSSPLCRLDNAVLLPHIGSATHETRLAMVRCAVDNLIAALDGDLGRNCANAAAVFPPQG
ncbi:NAD(P)-dependent oxidoreductase [Zobellella sp. An-6]|uniref:NAD(P)-dependent oxidoreductase n=1 Tax=Zobellella sp. An-6 TaxID=3400218 RepID=UPI0040430098